MDIDYDKKDIKESPKVKSAPKKKAELPDGWGYYVKRGSHCVVDPDGRQHKFADKKAALEFANG